MSKRWPNFRARYLKTPYFLNDFLNVVFKVYDDYSLKNLFAEHVAKFNAKHEQELVFLDDVR